MIGKMCKRVNGAVVSASTVFHYQVKVHFFSESAQSFTEQPMKISLYGTLGEKEDISFVLYVHRMRHIHADASNTHSSDALSCYRAAKKAPT